MQLDLGVDAVQLQAPVELLRDLGRQLRERFVGLGHLRPLLPDERDDKDYGARAGTRFARLWLGVVEVDTATLSLWESGQRRAARRAAARAFGAADASRFGADVTLPLTLYCVDVRLETACGFDQSLT